MNRTINDGYKYNIAIDMQPLLTQEIEKVDLKGLLAKEMNLVKENIINYDLYICNKEKGYVFGLNNEYFSSPRIDNLECAFTSLKGFLKGVNKRNINVYACFDNEEVGSGTRQGADSSFLEDTLRRINEELGFNESKYLRAVSSSLMVSADNAHALHPNHPELYDGLNNVLMNKGIVIKVNAAQSYATDGLSSALFTSILDKVNVPYQYFTNRADLRGGGTLGNISSKHVSMMCVDMGLPQLAMHSSNETAGVKDVDYAIRAFEKYYSVSIINKNGSFIIEE
jgi:aspartyl aminopeptidase